MGRSSAAPVYDSAGVKCGGMDLEIGVREEINAHCETDDDDGGANPDLRHFHRVVRAEVAADDGAHRHCDSLRPQNGAGDNERDGGDPVDDCAENGFERVHLVDVGHAHGSEHGEVHDADAAAEIAAVDGDE